MNIAIIGFGIEGKAAYDYWAKLGYTITICDQDLDADVPEGVDRHLGPDYLRDLDNYDLVFRSAGINPTVLLHDNPGIESKITTTLNEFLRVSPTKNIIGVTGTKGKGTTSTLVTKILEASGKQVFLGGNIGVSPFSFLPELSADAWVVLEVSSFQLTDLRISPHIAVCLMMAPEHLNWHKDMDDYLHAKQQLFAAQTPDDIAIYYGEDPLSRQIADASDGQKLAYFSPEGAQIIDGVVCINGQTICRIDEIKLLGQHNWQNICAAITTAWQATQDVDAIRSIVTTFTGLEHRLEFVRTLDDIDYYDDSFGTTPETSIVALASFARQKVLILGGSDKGASFDALARAVVASDVRQVITIGQTASNIEAALQAQEYDNVTPGGETMKDIVETARDAAQPGDIVLLSPACASFGMFANYKERGDQFKEAVRLLV